MRFNLQATTKAPDRQAPQNRTYVLALSPPGRKINPAPSYLREGRAVWLTNTPKTITRGKNVHRLDLLSTSQKNSEKIAEGIVSDELGAEVAEELLTSRFLQAEKCNHGAPYICFQDRLNEWHISQGSCNHWECPRCGQIRARKEFARMVCGADELQRSGRPLYFVTLTCRGREMPLDEAERNYLRWCNRLLSALRARSKKQGNFWAYACVTERQKRGHPHSHLIMTFSPDDATETKKGQLLPNNAISKENGLYSEWLVKRCVSSGLGKMCAISRIKNPIGASAYLAKYFFKDALHAVWPKGWRRVRYSRSWPRLPEEPTGNGFPVVTLADWRRVSALGCAVYAATHIELHAALARLVTNVVPHTSYGELGRNRENPSRG